MPTGSGKSIVIADLLKQILVKWPHVKVLVLSHVQEIIEQNLEKLHTLLPEYKIGVYSASLRQKKIEQITIGSVQTIVNVVNKFSGFNLIVVDECHTIQPNDEGSYNKIFQAIPNARVIGYTATPFRYNQFLTDGNHIFDKIIYRTNIRTLIKKGYLSPIKSKQTKIEIDTSKLKVTAGDYSKKSLQEEVDRFGLTKSICDDMLQFKDKRKHWLVFCVSIEHAEHVADYLTSIGIEALAVHSKLSKEMRALILNLYTEGKIQAITNVGVLTTGFDYPGIDLISFMRPTKSHVLYRQMIGRGMRIAEGKEDCLLLDYAGNCKRLGPIDVDPVFSKPSKKGGGEGGGLTKTCPECNEIVHLKVKVCPDCGYQFPEQEKLLMGASGAPILSTERKPAKYEVYGAIYSSYQKPGKAPVLKVTYKLLGLKRIPEWISFESSSAWLDAQAKKWWRQRTTLPYPSTVKEALKHKEQLKIPKYIIVDESGKYPKILQYLFTEDANERRLYRHN
jgi:DNA repair protein RadD